MKAHFVIILALFFNTKCWSTSNYSMNVKGVDDPWKEYNLYRETKKCLQEINLQDMKEDLSFASRMGYNHFATQAINEYDVPRNLVYPLYEFLNNAVERKSPELTSLMQSGNFKRMEARTFLKKSEQSKKPHNLRKRVKKIDIERKSTYNMDENCREIFNDKKTN